MKTYEQRVRFVREFTIKAENAMEANDKLREAIDEAEFAADVQSEGHYEFEDEPEPEPETEEAEA